MARYGCTHKMKKKHQGLPVQRQGSTLEGSLGCWSLEFWDLKTLEDCLKLWSVTCSRVWLFRTMKAPFMVRKCPVNNLSTLVTTKKHWGGFRCVCFHCFFGVLRFLQVCRPCQFVVRLGWWLWPLLLVGSRDWGRWSTWGAGGLDGSNTGLWRPLAWKGELGGLWWDRFRGPGPLLFWLWQMFVWFVVRSFWYGSHVFGLFPTWTYSHVFPISRCLCQRILQWGYSFLHPPICRKKFQSALDLRQFKQFMCHSCREIGCVL